MENLTVTLDTAKKLKAEGFPQNAEVVWCKDDSPFLAGRYEQDHEEYPLVAAAPTAQEIADQLPKDFEWAVVPYGSRYSAIKWRGDRQTEKGRIGDTMAEALAALWLRIAEAKS
jgi:hypothetical protein